MCVWIYLYQFGYIPKLRLFFETAKHFTNFLQIIFSSNPWLVIDGKHLVQVPVLAHFQALAHEQFRPRLQPQYQYQ